MMNEYSDEAGTLHGSEALNALSRVSGVRIGSKEEVQEELDSCSAKSECADVGRRLSMQQAELLSRFQIELSMEVGELSLSLAEYLDLVPGQVFELQRPEESKVLLTLEGTVIAEAELVWRDDKLGLHILSVEDFGEQLEKSPR